MERREREGERRWKGRGRGGGKGEREGRGGGKGEREGERRWKEGEKSHVKAMLTLTATCKGDVNTNSHM